MKKFNLQHVKYITILVACIIAIPFVWKASIEEVLLFRLGVVGVLVGVVFASSYHYWLSVLRFNFRK